MKKWTAFVCIIAILMLVMPISTIPVKSNDSQNKVEVTNEELENLYETLEEIKGKDATLYEKSLQIFDESISIDENKVTWLDLDIFESKIEEISDNKNDNSSIFYTFAHIKGRYTIMEKNGGKLILKSDKYIRLIGWASWWQYGGPGRGFLIRFLSHIKIEGIFIGICSKGYVNGIGTSIDVVDFSDEPDINSKSSIFLQKLQNNLNLLILRNFPIIARLLQSPIFTKISNI